LLLSAVLLWIWIERRPRLLQSAVQQSIDIARPRGPQQQTRRTLLQRSTLRRCVLRNV